MNKRVYCIIFVLVFMMMGCSNMTNLNSILNSGKTEVEYQNDRLAYGLIWENIAVIEETMDHNAKVESFAIDKSLSATSNNAFPQTAIGFTLGLDSLHETAISTLTKKGVDINYVDKAGKSYLIICAENWKKMNVRVFEVLLENGVNPNIRNENGDTALDMMLKDGKVSTELINSMLDFGTEINGKSLRYAYNNNQNVDMAGMMRIAQQVKESTGDIGLNIVIEAALFGDAQLLEKEISKGLTKKDVDFVTAYTAALGTKESLGKIVRNNKIDVNSFQYQQRFLTEIAAEFGNFDTIKYLVEEGADINRASKTTPLLEAIKNNHIEIVKYLIKSGVNFRSKPTVLLDQTEDELTLAALNGNAQMIYLLLENGVPTDISHMFSAMRGAINNDHLEVLELLVEQNKGIVSGEDSDDLYIGMPPLVFAASENKLEAMDYLVKKGDSINGDENNGEPLKASCFAKNAEAMKWIFEHGGSVANIHIPNYQSILLSECVNSGLLEELSILLEYHANANEVDENGISMLMKAAQKGSATILETLIESGANINAVYKGPITEEFVSGDTALHVATRRGWREIVDLLLKTNADTTIKNEVGQTAYDIAKEWGNEEVTKLYES